MFTVPSIIPLTTLKHQLNVPSLAGIVQDLTCRYRKCRRRVEPATCIGGRDCRPHHVESWVQVIDVGVVGRVNTRCIRAPCELCASGTCSLNCWRTGQYYRVLCFLVGLAIVPRFSQCWSFCTQFIHLHLLLMVGSLFPQRGRIGRPSRYKPVQTLMI